MGIRRETAEIRTVLSADQERKDRTVGPSEGQVKDGVSQDALRNLLRR